MLKDFWLNEALRNEVREYLVCFIADEGTRKIFAREDVSGVADAKEMIDKAFDNLDVMFLKNEKKNTIDQAV